MSARRIMVIIRQEMRILRRDPLPVLSLVLMPLVLMAFLRPERGFVLANQGYSDANGAEEAVPGMTVLFAFFLVSFVPFAFFREHGWGTWDRLRASPARPAEIVVGKLAPVLAISLVQQALLFALGAALFDMRTRGSPVALGLLIIALACCLTTLGLMLTAVVHTFQQVNASANVGALVLGGLGGALTPVTLLPDWVRAVAPASPAYWAMRGFRSVLLDDGGIGAVALPIAVLTAFAAAFTAIFLLRFRYDESKVSVA
ncbi:ABC transporter permease [Actinomadura madurae]|uniref:ABC transporter permease n=1 Tax=Actinomadura madurae TaxID=1993 RepID=UPI000D9DDB32|nr:ABC transporter permease [Actinomadura madurae]SPT58067.1 Inner membrane transport permease ybhR [Actinomadura madurae]